MRLTLAAAVFALALQSPPAPEPWSDIEQLKLDALAQEGRALDAEQKVLTLMRERWQARVDAFKSAAEAKRPGFTWNAETGAWSPKEKK